jgi:voltage-gated potassium channel
MTTPPERLPIPDKDERRRGRRAAIRSFVRATVVAVVVIAAYYLMPVRTKSDLGLVVRVVLVSASLALVVAWEIRAVARAEFPRLRAIDALVSTVSVMVIAFAISYLNMSRRHAESFNVVLERTSSLYFTVTTLATVGYGDIHAQTDAARIVVMIQMVFNVAVIGTTVRAILGTARHRGGRSAPGS